MSPNKYSWQRWARILKDKGSWWVGKDLVRRGFTYVRVRLRSATWQLLHAKLPSDRLIRSCIRQEPRDLQAWMIEFCEEDAEIFTLCSRGRRQLLDTFQERFPAQCFRIIARADLNRSGYFFMFEREILAGKVPDWHKDPVRNSTWPRVYVEMLDRWLWSGSNQNDYRFIWELNRHQHFISLGKAYWLSGDEVYTNTFIAHLLSWTEQNPKGMGINWYSSLEIALRLISWVFAFAYFRHSPVFQGQAAVTWLKSVYQQADYLFHNLTIQGPVRNNHILGEAAALVLVATVLSDFKDAEIWLDVGLRTFMEEIELQTFPDGVNREQASSYHRFVMDFLIMLVVLMRKKQLTAVSRLEVVLEKMLDYNMHALTPAGKTIMLADSDHGRGVMLDESVDYWDAREWLAAGAVLFQRGDFKFVATRMSEAAFWLLGPAGVQEFDNLAPQIPDQVSKSYRSSGHFIFRDHWGRDSDFAFMRCGPFGLGGEGFSAHSHCDLLSPILCIEGLPVLVDSGTFTYRGPGRNAFRKTAAHNTVRIDAFEQAIPDGPFAWRGIMHADCLQWDKDGLIGRIHYPARVTHTRELLHPHPAAWYIIDRIDAPGHHQIEWFFHFHPDIRLGMLDVDELFGLYKGGRQVFRLRIPNKKLAVSLFEGWYSPVYGQRIRNPVLQATWEGEIGPDAISFTWSFMHARRTGMIETWSRQKDVDRDVG